MSITYKINKEFNGIEIKFSEKPTFEVLQKLKALGFRWHPAKCVWYAKSTDERLEFAKSIENSDEYKQISLFTITEDKTEETTKVEPKKVEVVEDKPKKTEKKTEKKADSKTTKEKATTTPPKAQEKPKKNNIIEFAKARPDIKVRMDLTGKATIEDCKAKIDKAKEVYKDSDSWFVLDGLYEMCKVNENFRNNFMQENKTYEGAFKYFMNLARQGFAHTFNGVAYMDNNLALGMAMDYFNKIDEE